MIKATLSGVCLNERSKHNLLNVLFRALSFTCHLWYISSLTFSRFEKISPAISEIIGQLPCTELTRHLVNIFLSLSPSLYFPADNVSKAEVSATITIKGIWANDWDFILVRGAEKHAAHNDTIARGQTQPVVLRQKAVVQCIPAPWN